jgi:hypothetical protein
MSKDTLDFPAPVPWDDEYDPKLDAFSSWQLAIDWMHARMVAELIADYDNRLPEDWICPFDMSRPRPGA